MNSPGYVRFEANQSLTEARHQAFVQDMLATLTGRSNDLLAFEDVRRLLRGQTEVPRGTRIIPVDRIVGSVGRYRDFTRSFLPRQQVNSERWVGVEAAVLSGSPMPPIDVYQLGQVYFVRDGNHRVSVARANGATEIEARVTEIPVKIPPQAGDDVNDLILKAEYTEFLEQSHLDAVRPGADIRFTVPGQYPILLEHICVHQYFLGLERQAAVSWEDAVGSWHDEVYLPAIGAIAQQEVLLDFPGRTLDDFYIWVMDRLQELREAYGPQLTPLAAAQAVAQETPDRHRARWKSWVGRRWRNLRRRRITPGG